MTNLPEAGTEPQLDGWELLAQGRWASAAEAFNRTLSRQPTAEAWEGLSWAAWWLDDRARVFEAREAAFRLYRQEGRPAAAGRIAAWLAADRLDFDGAVAVARGWLRRAHRLLDPLGPGPEAGWLHFHEGYVDALAGRPEAARALAAEAAAIGREHGVPDLEMLGLALQGRLLVGAAQLEEGMALLDEATAIALQERATVPISGAWTCCLLIGACTCVLDYDRAFEWCDRVADFAERYGSRWMLGFCRAEYGTVHLWRGRWALAEQVLGAAIGDFTASRPAWIDAPLTRLADLRRLQGRYEEAAALLDRAGGPAATVVRAWLALDRGDARRAAELAERALRQVGASLPAEAAPALEILAEARLARGELDGAEECLEMLRRGAGPAPTTPMRSRIDRIGGLLALARGEPADARRLLEDAVDGFRASGAPFDVARTRLDLATCLLAGRRPAEARGEAAAARADLERLGAPVQVRRAERLEHAIQPGVAGAPSRLTPRERDVVACLVEGLTNAQIARRLVVSEHTVHRHVTNVLRKLDLPSRTAAAAWAVRTGVAAAAGEPER